MQFRESNPEHPHINYRHMPIRALYELGRLVEDTCKRLQHVDCPVLIAQATEDPIVDPESANMLHECLGSIRKTLVAIPSKRHGILYQDIGETQAKVLSFLDALAGSDEENVAVVAENTK